MRVCLISREYPPETGWGGIATFTQHLAAGLTEIGHEVEVVSLAKDQAKTVREGKIIIHRVCSYSFGLGTLDMCMPYSHYVLKTSSALWHKFYELHTEKPFDVVDAPELLAEGIYPAVTRCAPLLVRLYTPHSKFIAERLHNVVPSFDHQFVAMVERAAMVAADVLTSPSEDLADYVARDLNLNRSDIFIVRNPIDPRQFSPQGDQALAKDGCLKVLFVGRLEERKGIHYLLDAVPRVMSSFPAVRFIVIGDDTRNGAGQRSVLSELKQILAKSGSDAAVTFIPRVPLEALPSYYRSADICVVPSVYDNSPYTCLEAMSCGRPVIGTEAGGTKEYIIHGESGIVVPARNAEAIAHCILELASNESMRQTLGRNARARVLAHFQRQEIARQTAELYKIAIERYSQRHKCLYLRDHHLVLDDARSLFASLDKMLYDYLYQWSWRFRASHWIRLGLKRPRLFLAKLALGAAKGIWRLTARSSSPQVVAQLEAAIAQKQLPAEEQAMAAAKSRQ